MNLPNKLTMLRVLLIPVFVVFLSCTPFWCQLVALAVFIFACLTDLFDGKIARARNLVTNFGKFADPIADKLLVMSGYVVLVAQARMPAWVCIVFLAREFMISGLRLVAAGMGNVISAGILGKIKTVTQMIATIAIILFVPVGGAAPTTATVWESVSAFVSLTGNAARLPDIGVMFANVLMYIALVITIASGVDYMIKNKNCIDDM